MVLDGENAWGAYREDARPFLHALYGLLERDVEVQTVTFGEYLDGHPDRGIAPHQIFDGEWKMENGPLLPTPPVRFPFSPFHFPPSFFEALYMAEGSDWFWWFGAAFNRATG